MSKNISLKEAISIGIGGMVGGGIFAVLGLAVSLAKGGTPVAFLFAGILALITSYSYVNLSKTYPDSGGTVKFINQGFGINIFSGAMNNLLWISYIIMLSLYASAFGSYAPNLWQITGSKIIDFHIYASAVVVIATIINYYSITMVGKIESYAVGIKLIILIGFVIIGGYGLIGNPNLEQLSIKNWESPVKLFAGGMVIFVAYEGFELIANAVPNIINPSKNIARAYYYSVVFVIILYIIIAIVTVGSLPFNEIAKAEDYVLAEAAKPMLGQIGFSIITVAALISTFSAINASIYGGSRVNYEIAQDDELPKHYLSLFWNQPIGLLITSVATLFLVNILNLESISLTGSIGFILIFGIVNFVGFKLHKEVNGNKYIPLFGFWLSIIALLILIYQQIDTNIEGIIISGVIVFSCFLMEWLHRRKASLPQKKEAA
ncbi:MAG: APC family permease [Chitinophagales bacterium]